ncbi:UNKNOWN [Stylonychia lemnae]|uniref:Uncharacterized protein n=1 Tax=Stylonychia lemnae TaxID=5949 RepID=A0A078A9B5_STYLE|nr:UNKNOWN [Stylonychia lemnae]|eukprot:CDW78865.1 UNKNOWN [Stylonychia lemnae]
MEYDDDFHTNRPKLKNYNDESDVYFAKDPILNVMNIHEFGTQDITSSGKLKVKNFKQTIPVEEQDKQILEKASLETGKELLTENLEGLQKSKFKKDRRKSHSGSKSKSRHGSCIINKDQDQLSDEDEMRRVNKHEPINTGQPVKMEVVQYFGDEIDRPKSPQKDEQDMTPAELHNKRFKNILKNQKKLRIKLDFQHNQVQGNQTPQGSNRFFDSNSNSSKSNFEIIQAQAYDSSLKIKLSTGKSRNKDASQLKQQYLENGANTGQNQQNQDYFDPNFETQRGGNKKQQYYSQTQLQTNNLDQIPNFQASKFAKKRRPINNQQNTCEVSINTPKSKFENEVQRQLNGMKKYVIEMEDDQLNFENLQDSHRIVGKLESAEISSSQLRNLNNKKASLTIKAVKQSRNSNNQHGFSSFVQSELPTYKSAIKNQQAFISQQMQEIQQQKQARLKLQTQEMSRYNAIENQKRLRTPQGYVEITRLGLSDNNRRYQL